MGKIKGIQITLYEQTDTGDTDPFGTPIVTETAVQVDKPVREKGGLYTCNPERGYARVGKSQGLFFRRGLENIRVFDYRDRGEYSAVLE